MRRNQVIYNRKLSHNIKNWPGYHISKRGRLYKYYPKRNLWMLMKGTISRNRTYHILRTDNKRIRKVIRKAIRNHENNNNKRR